MEKKLEQMPIDMYKKLTDDEKEELWKNWKQEARHSRDSRHHMLEFWNIIPDKLSEMDWIVWDMVDKGDINEEYFSQIAEQEMENTKNNFNPSKSSLYAMLRNHLIIAQTKKRFGNKFN